jgi:hypothetical protein
MSPDVEGFATHPSQHSLTPLQVQLSHNPVSSLHSLPEAQDVALHTHPVSAPPQSGV